MNAQVLSAINSPKRDQAVSLTELLVTHNVLKQLHEPGASETALIDVDCNRSLIEERIRGGANLKQLDVPGKPIRSTIPTSIRLFRGL
jgi:hypothetical protein